MQILKILNFLKNHYYDKVFLSGSIGEINLFPDAYFQTSVYT